ncbi:Pex12 amino terminal region-domain-containing protein [Coniella lustricola]|uniref:Pex12 amino terminal region-domain-containing protein n=1 Tax=Coniella lustricola TaxID=2025994 RepID=A0A2T3AAS8_9PEZI|nr:Pex12 amino terminal region-domain-containing protein [Coniella lustricola]
MTSASFAQAQARLAEHRAAREAQARARLAADQSASRLRSHLSAHPSPLLRSVGGHLFGILDGVSSREGTRPAFRVSQVDAELLDEELLALLHEQVADALKYLGGVGSTLKDDWADEILLLLRAVLFKLTVWDHNATYGAALQNLRYTDARHQGPVAVPPSRTQKTLYGLVTVGGRYAWARLEGWLLHQDDTFDEPHPRITSLKRLASAAESVHAAAAFMSFLVFLLHGRYRTLLDRILRMRLAPPTSQVSREVSFEYLNRQLVWHAFTEFLLFVLPLIGINKWRRWLTRTWRKTKRAVLSDAEGEMDEKTGEYAFLPERTCAICYQDQNTASTEQEVLAAAASSGIIGSAQTDVTNPYETIPCGCIYCFVCLATRIEGEDGEGWTCLRCGELVKECRPWSGDVLEPPSKSPSQKAVMFADGVKEAASGVDTDSDTEPSRAESTEERDQTARESDSSVDGDSEEYDEEEGELGDDLDGF